MDIDFCIEIELYIFIGLLFRDFFLFVIVGSLKKFY